MWVSSSILSESIDDEPLEPLYSSLIGLIVSYDGNGSSGNPFNLFWWSMGVSVLSGSFSFSSGRIVLIYSCLSSGSLFSSVKGRHLSEGGISINISSDSSSSISPMAIPPPTPRYPIPLNGRNTLFCVKVCFCLNQTKYCEPILWTCAVFKKIIYFSETVACDRSISPTWFYSTCRFYSCYLVERNSLRLALLYHKWFSMSWYFLTIW